MIGGSLGVAASTAVFQNTARGRLEDLLAGLQPTQETLGKVLDVLTGAVAETSLGALIGERGPQIVNAAFDAAVGRAMWLSIVASLGGALVCALLFRRS
jgi:hypothetical protein